MHTSTVIQKDSCISISLASRPSYFRSAGCIASPARGKEGLETLARFSCSLEEFAKNQWGARCHVTVTAGMHNIAIDFLVLTW